MPFEKRTAPLPPVENVIKAYRLGHTITEISRMYGVDYGWVSYILRSNHVGLEQKGMDAIDVDLLVADYQSKLSLKEISQKYHVPAAKVKRLLQERNVFSAHHSKSQALDYSKLPVGAMITAYRRGARPAAIAHAHNLDVAVVHRALKKHGVTKKDWNSKPQDYRDLPAEVVEDEVDRVARMVWGYQQGVTITALARIFETTPHRVKQALINLGLYQSAGNEAEKE